MEMENAIQEHRNMLMKQGDKTQKHILSNILNFLLVVSV